MDSIYEYIKKNRKKEDDIIDSPYHLSKIVRVETFWTQTY